MFRRKLQPVINVEWLIVGLGNPGAEYARTRHNVGFDVIEELASRHKIKINKAKHRARIGVGEIDGTGVALAMPLTFMNNSGQSVAPMMREYGLKPERVLIVSDDLDMDLARVRLKPKGGSGGHNGHKSIIKNLGTEEYPRLKIGIHSDKRDETVDFVLSRFTPEERVDINNAVKKSAESIEVIVTQGLELALSRTNES